VDDSSGPLAELWRAACALVASEDDTAWADPESESLLAAILAAGRLPSPPESGASNQAQRYSALDRASRSWARTQSSLPTLTSRLTQLKAVMAADMMGEGDVDLLDVAVRTVVATANKEFALKLQHAALTDPLTGTGNRRALDVAWRTAVIQGQGWDKQSVSWPSISTDSNGLTTSRVMRQEMVPLSTSVPH
jgi:hypothetical protein